MSRPTHLWKAWPGVSRRLARAKTLVLLCDFDGTLVPIVGDARQVKLPGATRAALAGLGRSPRTILGIVSGRQVSELRRLVGLRCIYYVGIHGLECVRPGEKPRLRATLGRRRIREIARTLRRALRGVAGAWVERKSANVAVHFRLASPRGTRRALSELRRLARRYNPPLPLLRGKKVAELMPDGETSKGTAVEELTGALRPRRGPLTVLYLGDDTSDETVFARLRRKDIGILVGRPRPTSARFYLRSPGQVREFLERLRELWP